MEEKKIIIEIKEDLFIKIKELMKNRSVSISKELENIKPLDTVATDNTLQKAREVKTAKVKRTIKQSIKELLNDGMSPTKYQINKKTGIAFITLNKYYDEILEEVKNGK